jgi:hypothetical protein
LNFQVHLFCILFCIQIILRIFSIIETFSISVPSLPSLPSLSPVRDKFLQLESLIHMHVDTVDTVDTITDYPSQWVIGDSSKEGGLKAAVLQRGVGRCGNCRDQTDEHARRSVCVEYMEWDSCNYRSVDRCGVYDGVLYECDVKNYNDI